MISIKQALRQDGAANLDDVLTVKRALFTTGHFEVPEYGLTTYPDQALFTAIKGFQRDKGLKMDGVINPGGETLARLNQELDEEGGNGGDLGARSPTFRCPECGASHGGSKGDLCPDCDEKN